MENIGLSCPSARISVAQRDSKGERLNCAPFEPSNQAFTLIELLVVISIIVLLIALLLPALGAAKQNAKIVMCQSNLHQITMAMEHYALDEDGYYPILAPPGWTGTWKNRGSYGMVGCPPGSDPPTGRGCMPKSFARLIKYDYLDNVLALRCPGRDYEDWPTEDIDNYLNPPPWPYDGPGIDEDGDTYPWRVCYQMRGWLTIPNNWRVQGHRQAIAADIIANYWVAQAAHEMGVTVGYSDASVTFISGDTPYDANRTFFEQMRV